MNDQNINGLDYISPDLLRELSEIQHEIMSALDSSGPTYILSIGRSTKIFEEFNWGKHTFKSLPVSSFRFLEKRESDWGFHFPINLKHLMNEHLEKYHIDPDQIDCPIVILDFAISGNTFLSFLQFFKQTYGSSTKFSVKGLALYHDPNREVVLKTRFPELDMNFINIAGKKRYIQLLKLKAFKDVYPDFGHVFKSG